MLKFKNKKLEILEYHGKLSKPSNIVFDNKDYGVRRNNLLSNLID